MAKPFPLYTVLFFLKKLPRDMRTGLSCHRQHARTAGHPSTQEEEKNSVSPSSVRGSHLVYNAWWISMMWLQALWLVPFIRSQCKQIDPWRPQVWMVRVLLDTFFFNKYHKLFCLPYDFPSNTLFSNLL